MKTTSQTASVTNVFHSIRIKEEEYKRKQQSKQVEEKNMHLERKRLSNVYSTPSTIVSIKRNKDPFDVVNMDKFLYVTTTASKDQELLIAEGVKDVTGPIQKLSRTKTYFIPTLVELCADTAAKQFEKLFENDATKVSSLPTPLMEMIAKRLDGKKIPLQLSCKYLHLEEFWKKSCTDRWTPGQLLTFLQSDETKIYDSRRDGPLPMINSFTEKVKLDPNRTFKTWKQIYLEKNLQEFIENIQSKGSMYQELKILSHIPDQPHKVSDSQFVNTMLESNLHSVKLAKSTTEKAEETQSQPILIQQSTNSLVNLHSNQMKPNLNYYLLHLDDPSKLPNQLFRNRLKSICDGNETRVSSRLNNVTSGSDDIFTFYENAISKQVFLSGSRQQLTDTRYWILNKQEISDEEDFSINQMITFVEQENQKRVLELCELSANSIQDLEIFSLRSHISLTLLLQSLHNLRSLKLSYRVQDAGMSFEMNMSGMRVKDCSELSNALLASHCASLQVLHLNENGIDDLMLLILVKGLVKNTVLKELSLSHNKIGNEGCKALASYLYHNQSLQRLYLCNNKLEVDSAQYLGMSLLQNKCLQVLDLRLNQIKETGAIQLLTCLVKKHDSPLQRINLSSNQIENGIQLSKLIVDSKLHLQQLDLSSNLLSREVCEYLQQQHTLMIQELDLRGNMVIELGKK